ncbi:MAG: VWA domain-containing protein, partial [Myxococcota bacterium]
MKRWMLELAGVAVATVLCLVALSQWIDATTFRWESGGETYELLEPSMLLLLAAAPFLVWVVLRSLADLPGIQRVLSIVLRGLLIATLTLALARLSRTTEATKVSTIFLVDVSDSVTDEGLEEARRHVTAAYEAKGENDVQLVTFAKDARVVSISEGVTAIEGLARPEDPDSLTGSNLQAALQLAYGLFPPGHLRRVVLISDGGQTEGDLLAEAGRANRFRTKIFYHPYRSGAPAEVAVQDLGLPDRIRVGDPFFVRAEIFSSRDTNARVRLYQGETLNGLDGVRDIELTAGRNELTFESVVRIAGPVTYRLNLEAEGPDRFEANNEFETSVVVPGRPTVLYVEGARGRASYLAQALTAADYEVDVRSPRGIPTNMRELERFDFFILSDVSADQVSLTQIDA